MYISKLTIQNYRNFKNFTINLKPFTLIIGENNIGKTNLLNAIGLILSQDITFFKRRILEIDDINYKSILEFKESVKTWDGVNESNAPKFPEVIVEIIITDFDVELEQKAIVSDWHTDSSCQEAKLTYCFGYKGDIKKWAKDNIGKDIIDIDFPIQKCDYHIYGGNDKTRQAESHWLRMLKMELLDGLRDAQKELVASGDNRLIYKILSNRDETLFKDIKDKLRELNDVITSDDEKNEKKELTKVTESISNFLKKISLHQDDTKHKVGFRFTSLEYSEILKKLSLTYGDNPISVERNGLGRNNLLFISLLLSHLTSEAVEKQNVFFRLIGLEEPEAHLHPHLQEHLALNIENEVTGKMQILLTSHSTHITSKLNLENTVVLYWHEGSNDIKSHYILNGMENKKGKEDKESNNHKRYLSRYLDATKSTLLFGRKIILVEGISEQILIPRFFELYTNNQGEKKTLEKMGCTLVNVNSVAFKHFLELVVNSRSGSENFFIHCLAITDSDSETNQAENRADGLKRDYQDYPQINIAISTTNTFEKDIIKANNSGKAKNILLNAIKKTRPEKGLEYESTIIDKDIDIDDFFSLIEYVGKNNKKVSYKADFATDLFDILKKVELVDKKDRETVFNIPQYIVDGFDFILGVNQNNDEKAIKSE